MEPFPYTDAARLVSVQIHDTERNEPGGRGGYSGPEFLDYVEQNHVFDRVIANDGMDLLYRSGEGTERFDGSLITPGTFEFLACPRCSAASLSPADYEPGAPPVFVMRYKTWVSRFSADPRSSTRPLSLMERNVRLSASCLHASDGRRRHVDPAKAEAGPPPRRATGPQFWFLAGTPQTRCLHSPRQNPDLTVVAKNLAKIYPKD